MISVMITLLHVCAWRGGYRGQGSVLSLWPLMLKKHVLRIPYPVSFHTVASYCWSTHPETSLLYINKCYGSGTSSSTTSSPSR